MSRDPGSPDDDVDPAERAGTERLLSMLFVPIFEKAILSAPSEPERAQLSAQFAASPMLDFHSIKKLFAAIAHIEAVEQRHEDAKVLLFHAKALSNAFLEQRTDKHKNGISIQYAHNGEIIISVGHALNEGVTEGLTKNVGREYLNRTGATPAEREEWQKATDGTYLIEVAAAAKLIARFGETLVGRAYFGSIDDLEELRKAFDAQCGPGSFIRLLQTSDRGEWRTAFAIIEDAHGREER